MSDDYEVGYGKPPRKHQFEKGRSGNPAGRPKGTKNLKTDLSEELAERIVIKEGNRTIRISKQRALIKALFANSIKGETRAANIVVNLILKLDPAGQVAPEEKPLSPEESETLAALKERFLRKLLVKDGGGGEAGGRRDDQ